MEEAPQPNPADSPMLGAVAGALELAENAARGIKDARPPEPVAALAEDWAAQAQAARSELAAARARAPLAATPPELREAARRRLAAEAVAEAQRRLRRGRLTEPRAHSAYDALLEAHHLAPDTPGLAEGFNTLVEHYIERARAAMLQGRYDDFYRVNALIDQIKAARAALAPLVSSARPSSAPRPASFTLGRRNRAAGSWRLIVGSIRSASVR